MSPPAGSLAALLMRRQGTVFAASLMAGFGVTLATGRPVHELLTHGARAARAHAACAAQGRGRRLPTSAQPTQTPFRGFAAGTPDARRADLAGASASSGDVAYSFRVHGSGPPMSQ
jgi:hypothetical protein